MTPLRGRETELASLGELADSLRAGACGVVVVEGAAGIGKSRLLAEARSRAAAGGLLVAAGGADELDQVTPWAPLLGALGSSEPPVLASGELGSLRSLGDQRLAVIERMQAALERASSSRPVLVVLDDLQWADTATLLALGSLPLSLFSYPVGWLLALRPLPARPALDGLLDRLAEVGAIRLHLGLPGDEAAVAVMHQAVNELAPSSPGAAADLALRVLELAGEDDEHRAQLVLSAVQVLGLAGRSAEARDVFESYLARRRLPAAVEAELQLQLRQALVVDQMDTYPVPVPVRLLGDPSVDPAVRATLTALEQVPKIWHGQAAEADRALEHARQAVAESGRADELTVVNWWRVQASLHRGRAGEAVARARAALDAAQPLAGLPEEMVVTALAADGRISEALGTMRDALAAARDEGRAGLVFRYRRLRAAMLLSQGRLEDADAEARGVIDLPAKLGYPHRTAHDLRLA